MNECKFNICDGSGETVELADTFASAAVAFVPCPCATRDTIPTVPDEARRVLIIVEPDGGAAHCDACGGGPFLRIDGAANARRCGTCYAVEPCAVRDTAPMPPPKSPDMSCREWNCNGCEACAGSGYVP